ncbi:AAWKG family protein [Streptomyces sp. enrichment culture]|uniref:AAWKG family protein n=1 Tax=Streptomyces sp. enrichment culture TaxID=1795815 RepID=UPI003F55DA9C
MAKPADDNNNEDNWKRAVELLTGYPLPKRSELFNDLRGNDDIPLMHVRLEDLNASYLPGFASPSGWKTHNTDYTIPFYVPVGDNPSPGTTVYAYRAYITFLGGLAHVVPNGEDEIPATSKTSEVLKNKGIWNNEGDKLDWDTNALVQYVYGSRDVLAHLKTWPHTTHGYKSRSRDVSDAHYVDLLSFTETAKAFDRAVKFFESGALTIGKWDTEDIGEGSDSWDGTSAAIFKELIHKLARNYEGYADQVNGKGGTGVAITIDNVTVTSEPARALAAAQRVLLEQVTNLYNAWEAWRAESNPQRWLYDMLQAARLHVLENQHVHTDLDADYYYNGMYGTNTYTMVTKEDFVSEIVIEGKPYGKPTDIATWKAIGEEAIRRWDQSVQDWLSTAGAKAIVAVYDAFTAAQKAFDTSLTDKDKGDLSEIASKVEADAAKKEADAAAAAARAQADADRAEAKARADADRAEAKARADADRARADADRAEAKARADADRAQADADRAEAKARADADRAQADADRAEAKAQADADRAEAKARADADRAEADKDKAEAKARADADRAEADKERAEAKQAAAQQQAFVLAQNQKAQDEARKERERAYAQAEADRAEAKAAQEEAKARAEQERAEAKAAQEQEKAEAKAQAEADRAEARAAQEEARARAEQERAEAKAAQEAAQAEARAERDAARQEQSDAQAEAEAAQEEARREALREQQQARLDAQQARDEAQADYEQQKAEARAERDAALAEADRQEAEARREYEREKAEAQEQREQAREEAEQDRAEARAEYEREIAAGTPEAEARQEYDRRLAEIDAAEREAVERADAAEAEARREYDQAKADAQADRAEARSEAEQARKDAKAEYDQRMREIQAEYDRIDSGGKDIEEQIRQRIADLSEPPGLAAINGAAAADSMYSSVFNDNLYNQDDLASALGRPAGSDAMAGTGTGSGSGSPGMYPPMTRGAGGEGGGSAGERTRNVIEPGVTRSGRTAGTSAAGDEEHRVVPRGTQTSSSMPFMPPMGGMGGAGEGRPQTESGDRERTTWLTEDEDVWGTDEGGAPQALGR